MSDPAFLPEREPPLRSRPFMVLAAGLATAGLLALALHLGHWAFAARSASLHQRRLERLLEQKPYLEQVVAALRDDGMIAAGEARNAGALRDLIARWGGGKSQEIEEQGQRWSLTRVFTAEGAVYFLFFDDQEQMRGFVFANR